MECEKAETYLKEPMVSDTAQSPDPLTRIALAAAPRAVHVLAPAIGCLALAVYFAGGLAGLAFLVAGVTLVCLAILMRWLVHRYRSRQRHLWSAVAALIEHDPTANFVTSDVGRLLYANPAAEGLFGRIQGRTLEAILGDHFAAPASVLHRLRVIADAKGAASEDVASSQGALRLTVRRVDPGGYVWRLETREADLKAEPTVAMAMLRVSTAGTIVDMNGAMESLLGGRPQNLDRVVADLPLRPGKTHLIDAAAGQIEAQLSVMTGADGLQQIFVWPGGAPDRAWTHSDAIPVPLMKISTSGKILMANRRAKKLLAIPDGATLDFADVVEGLGRPVDEWLLDVSEGRAGNRTEVVSATRPQQDVFLQVALGRMVEGSDVSLLAVLIDATELKTLEAQFVQSQKMQAIGQIGGRRRA